MGVATTGSSRAGDVVVLCLCLLLSMSGCIDLPTDCPNCPSGPGGPVVVEKGPRALLDFEEEVDPSWISGGGTQAQVVARGNGQALEVICGSSGCFVIFSFDGSQRVGDGTVITLEIESEVPLTFDVSVRGSSSEFEVVQTVVCGLNNTCLPRIEPDIEFGLSGLSVSVVPAPPAGTRFFVDNIELETP